MKVSGIGWLGLVSDRPETRRFYAKVLGLNLVEDTPAYAYYAIDETTNLEILARDTRLARIQDGCCPAVGLLVEDLDSAVRELKAAGANLKGEIEEWRSDNERHRWIYFEDPDGHTLLLMHKQRGGPSVLTMKDRSNCALSQKDRHLLGSPRLRNPPAVDTDRAVSMRDQVSIQVKRCH